MQKLQKETICEESNCDVRFDLCQGQSNHHLTYMTCSSLSGSHSICIEHQYETLYEEYNCGIKFDLALNVEVKSNIDSLK